jgi:AmmeMemoRadiSam system protein A
MSSTDGTLTTEEKNILLDVARRSIEYGLQHARPLPVNTRDYSNVLQQPRATFVTLHLHNQLRGCIGTLNAYQPLINDVAEHAFAAAFRDPRFEPVTSREAPQLDIHISILTQAAPMTFNSEEDLLRQLNPGVDGLILESGYHRGTFLPSVWEQLPQPEKFLQHLKLKAGLAAGYWDKNIKVSRYTTLSIP